MGSAEERGVSQPGKAGLSPEGQGGRVQRRRLRQGSQAEGREGRQCHEVTVLPEGGGVGPRGMYLPAETPS